jgi:hypothetical protein
MTNTDLIIASRKKEYNTTNKKMTNTDLIIASKTKEYNTEN